MELSALRLLGVVVGVLLLLGLAWRRRAGAFLGRTEMLLWPGARAQAWQPPAPTIAPSIGHHREWLQAIRDGQPTAPLCGIPYATRLTELVLLGTVAYRAARAIQYVPGSMRIEGDPAANRLLGDAAQAGWTLPRA